MLDFSIRAAQTSDLDDCVWFDGQESLEPFKGDRKRQLIESRINTGDIFLACDRDGQKIGYFRIDHLWPQMLPVLGWVFVKPGWREGGVMAALYQHMLEVIMERGHRRFVMSTQSNRPDVMDLFRSIGMREVGRLKTHDDLAIEEVFYLYALPEA